MGGGGNAGARQRHLAGAAAGQSGEWEEGEGRWGGQGGEVVGGVDGGGGWRGRAGGAGTAGRGLRRGVCSLFIANVYLSLMCLVYEVVRGGRAMTSPSACARLTSPPTPLPWNTLFRSDVSVCTAGRMRVSAHSPPTRIYSLPGAGGRAATSPSACARCRLISTSSSSSSL